MLYEKYTFCAYEIYFTFLFTESQGAQKEQDLLVQGVDSRFLLLGICHNTPKGN